MNWTTKGLKPQEGKTILVTGANTGLGKETCIELSKKGAHIIMTGRNHTRLKAAMEEIQENVPKASLEIGVLDLGSLNSVKQFAKEFSEKHDKLDILINNAGIMFPPPGKTEDGFESQFGVNFIGHYALTSLLFPILKRSKNSRVITLSSKAHHNNIIDFGNLKLEKPFDKFREYGQSKVADLIFTLELQRRIDKANLSVQSIGAHPGISKTELLRTDLPEAIENFDYMDANQGSFSTLYAATEDIKGGSYIGPNGKDEINGYPSPAVISEYAQGEEVGRKLWKYAEEETGIYFDFTD